MSLVGAFHDKSRFAQMSLKVGSLGALKVGGSALNYVFLVIVARILGPAEYGVFAVFLSAALLLCYVATFGQHLAVLRFFHGIPGDARDKSYLLLALRSTAILGGMVVVSAGIFLFLSSYIALEPRWTRPVSLLAGCLAVMLAFSEVLSSVARSLGKSYLAVIPKEIVWRALQIVLFGTLLYIGVALSVEQLFLVSILTLLMALAVYFPEVASVWRKPNVLLRAEYLTWRRASTYLWLTSLIAPLMSQMAVIIIYIWLGPETAGLFFAADRTAQFISLGLTGVNQFIGPLLSRAYFAGNGRAVRNLMLMSSAISFAIGSAVFVVLWGMSSVVLGLFSESYVSLEGLYCLVLLGLGQLVNAMTGPIGQLLQLTGKERGYMWLLLSSNALGLALIVALSSSLGVVGAALSVMLSLMLTNLLGAAIGWRHIWRVGNKNEEGPSHVG